MCTSAQRRSYLASLVAEARVEPAAALVVRAADVEYLRVAEVRGAQPLLARQRNLATVFRLS